MKCITMVVAHKTVDIPLKNGYKIINVGPNEVQIEGAMRDNSGDNIAYKNPNYCELTAHYWFWKNYKEDYDYVGLAHYRRFLSSNYFTNNPKYYICQDNIEKYIKNVDVLLPEKFVFDCTVAEFYLKGAGIKKDFDNTREVIKNIYPEYVEAFDYCTSSNTGSYCNMFYMKKSDFEAYSKWLFDVLFELEKITDLTGYTPAEARIYGYLSELLLNVWIIKNEKRTKCLPMAVSDPGRKSYLLFRINSYLGKVKNNRLFKRR